MIFLITHLMAFYSTYIQISRRSMHSSVRWFPILIINICQSYSALSVPFELKTNTNYNDLNNNSKSRIFSPRMDYDEWTPLGRGDPLKNDPTFDYVPPVLDRVQYWLDSHESSHQSTESSSKRDILVLGVTAKKTSPKIPEHFFKFVDGPKFNININNNKINGTSISRISDNGNHDDDIVFHKDFTGSTGAEPPKIYRTTKFRPNNNGNIIGDFLNQYKIESLPMPSSYYPSPYYGSKSKLSTIMMPPPMTMMIVKSKVNHPDVKIDETPILFPTNAVKDKISQSTSTSSSLPSSSSVLLGTKQVTDIPSKSPLPPPSPSTTTTTNTVTFDKSNLIYQSSQTYEPWVIGTTSNKRDSSFIWNGNSDKSIIDNYEDHQISAASVNHHQVVEVGQNANIIVNESEENEQVVIGRKPENNVLASVFNESDGQELKNQQMPHANVSFISSNNDNDNNNDDNKHDINININTADLSSSSSNAPNNNMDGKSTRVTVVMPSNHPSPPNDTNKINESVQILPTLPPFNTSLHHQMPPMRTPPLKVPDTRREPSGLLLLNASSNHQMPPTRIPPLRMTETRRDPAGLLMFGHQMLRPKPKRPSNTIMMHPMRKHPIPEIPTPQSMFSSVSSSSISAFPAVPEYNHRFRFPDMMDMMPTSVPSPLAMLLDAEHIEKTTVYSTSRPSTTSTSSMPPTSEIVAVSSKLTTPTSVKLSSPTAANPTFLIIQGHSKVKTYKPVIQKYYGISNGDNNDTAVENTTSRPISKFEQFVNDNTRVVTLMTEKIVTPNNHEVKAKEKRVEHDSLLSLVESGFSAFTVPPSLQLLTN